MKEILATKSSMPLYDEYCEEKNLGKSLVNKYGC